jgi:23S rRNA pseudouridine1911/1915/1917 synthase
VRQTFVLDRGDAGRRIDHVIRRHLSGADRASRTRVQAWIAAGCVQVNGLPIHRPAARVASGAVVSIARPEPSPPARSLRAQDAPVTILYEDQYLVAVEKPAGVVAHPGYGHADGTMMNALAGLARSWPDGHRPSLVGRLDQFTSGVMIVARTSEAHRTLQRALASQEAAKDYLAIVYGKVKAARGRIDLGIEPDPADRRRRVVSKTTGAPSTTLFERLGRIAAPPVGLALLRCRLLTGRTHQIRVHLAARGWPIVGDRVYGAPHWQDVRDAELAAQLSAVPRQALHAWRMSFRHPWTGQTLTITAPLPQDLRVLTQLFKRRLPVLTRHDAGTEPSP